MRSYDLSKLNILVLEKHLLIQRLFRDVLREFNVGQVEATTDPKQAVGLLSDFMPNVIFCDWSAGLDGIAFLKKVRRNGISPNPYVPVVMVTAHTEYRHVYRARDSGMTEYLAKPISAQTIYGRICAVVENHRQFIKCGGFFGPDRRRRNCDVGGHDRRVPQLTNFTGLPVAPELRVG